MRRADWTLLAISSATQRGLTPVELQKSLFVLSREVPHNQLGTEFYTFVPYDYGPFCSAIYDDARLLESEGLVTISQTANGLRIYSPTPSGMTVAQMLRRAREGAADYLATVVKWAQSLSFAQLVQSIYNRYPDTAVNSVFAKS